MPAASPAPLRPARPARVAAQGDDYRRLFAADPVPALLVGLDDLVVLAANPAASRHYGYAESELVGMSATDLVQDESMPAELRGTPGWLATRSSWLMRHRNQDTSTVHLGPVVQFAGKPAYYLWSAPVVPEKPLGERASEMTAFAFAAFHDLKEPLQVVRGYLALLRPAVEADHDALDYLDTARAATERMQAMVLNLLEYFRLQTNATRPEPVALADALRQARETLQLSIGMAGGKVESDPLPTVMADRMQMVRLFQNLVANGIKFHAAGVVPTVHVSAERGPPGQWTVTVEDNGIGIPPAERERVFQPFHRLHSVDDYPGTGLGLSTCRLIVEAHGGRIWAEGAAGGGTAIHVTLPEA